MRINFRHGAVLLLMALLPFCVVGCGGSGNGAGKDPVTTSGTDPVTTPGTTTSATSESGDKGISNTAVAAPGGAVNGRGVVVRVGNETITKTAFEDRMRMEARALSPQHPIEPVPPAYRSCIAQLSALASGFSAGSSKKAAPTKGQLKGQCALLYRQRRGGILKELISSYWVIVGATEDGLGVSEEEVREKLRTEWPTAAKYHEFLAKTGENLPDLLFTVKVEMLSAKLRQRAEAIQPVTAAMVQSYYASHRSTFTQPEKRDIGIIRGRSSKTALRVKHELESGVEFAKVVHGAGLQPIFLAQRNSLLRELELGLLHEKELNDAIFSAKTHVISGPVRVNLFPGYHPRFHQNPNDVNNIDGYYVFEVYFIHPGYVKPFSQVRSALTHELPTILQKRELVSFVKGWRGQLRPKTDCSPGFVIPKCRQYRPVVGEPAEDAYTFN